MEEKSSKEMEIVKEKKVEKPEMKSSVSQTQNTMKPINQAEEKILKIYDKYHSETSIKKLNRVITMSENSDSIQANSKNLQSRKRSQDRK